MLDRIEFMISQGVPVDVMTMVLRSEGALDSDIARCYDSLAQSDRYNVEIVRGIANFVPVLDTQV